MWLPKTKHNIDVGLGRKERERGGAVENCVKLEMQVWKHEKFLVTLVSTDLTTGNF